MKLRDAWDEQADAWAQFARTPGHDRSHELVNFPAFLELLPSPGRATLDLGCGEGRVGTELVRLGHDVVGIDSSPRMVELAQEHHRAIVADAAALPFADGSFDLVVAYMSLMNMDDLEGAVRETGRVLEPGGRFCVSVLHPITASGSWSGDDFVVGDYFNGPVKIWTSDRDGIEMTFYDRPIPLSRYAGALEAAGLLVERIAEPVPGDAPDSPAGKRAFAGTWGADRLRRVPLFLHLRAVKP